MECDHKAKLEARVRVVVPALGAEVEGHRESLLLEILVQRLQHASGLQERASE
jgi:hypothetical protein